MHNLCSDHTNLWSNCWGMFILFLCYSQVKLSDKLLQPHSTADGAEWEQILAKAKSSTTESGLHIDSWPLQVLGFQRILRSQILCIPYKSPSAKTINQSFWCLYTHKKITYGHGGGDSSVVRAPDSWLKSRGFESLLERRENFLLQGRLSVLTLISVSVPPPCYHSST